MTKGKGRAWVFVFLNVLSVLGLFMMGYGLFLALWPPQDGVLGEYFAYRMAGFSLGLGVLLAWGSRVMALKVRPKVK